MRALNKGTVTFGLVSVPIKVYSANSPQKITLNLLSPEGHRVKMQFVDAVSGKVVDTKESNLKGYEYAKNQYVQFTEEELQSLEAHKDEAIEIKEFVPAEEIESFRIEKSFLLGTNGGDKSYGLLASVLEENWMVAIAQWKSRGRDHLVAIRPIREGGMIGLVMQQLFYQAEQNHITEVGVSGCDASDAEKELANKLIETLKSDTLDLSKYKNEYLDRLNSAVQKKIAGQQVTSVGQTVPNAAIIDLYEALKQSLDNKSPNVTTSAVAQG